MIQRIQTLYLFFAALLSSIMLFFPFAEISTQTNYALGVFYFENFKDGQVLYTLNVFPLGSLIILVLVLSFVSIFLFKKRKLQARITRINLLLNLGIYAMIAFYLLYETDFTFKMFFTLFSWKITISFPLISSIFLYLANRAILKDEALVRSIDRLR